MKNYKETLNHSFVSLNDLHLPKKEAQIKLLHEGYDPEYSGKKHGFYLNKPLV